MAKVLVVEDQPSIVAIVRYHLESAGFDGVFAGDVEEAWRLLVSESPDASVVDIKLPGASGWTFIERMRSDGRFHDLPVVVLTGLLEPEVVEKATELGCDYLSKPFAASALLTKIQELIRSSGPRAAPSAPPGRTHTQLVSVGVVVLMTDYQVEGKVYLPPELGRFSDAWESIMRDQREFVPITEARVTSADGAFVISSPTFIEVRKRDVQAVYPMDLAE